VTQAWQPRQALAVAAFRGLIRRDIAIALAVKFALLVALYLVCFSPAHRARVTSDSTATALMGQGTPETQQ